MSRPSRRATKYVTPSIQLVNSSGVGVHPLSSSTGRPPGWVSTTFLYSAQIAATSWWVTRSTTVPPAIFSWGFPFAPGLRSVPRSDPCSVVTIDSPVRERGARDAPSFLKPCLTGERRSDLRRVARRGTGEGGRLADVFAPEHPAQDPLHPEPEAGVRDAPVTTEIEVPFVLLEGGARLLQAFGEAREVGLAARTADHLAVPLGREKVRRLDRAGVVLRAQHVERLQLAGKVRDEDRGVGLERQRALLGGRKVAAPLHRKPLCRESVDRLGVAEAGERCGDPEQFLRSSPELGELVRSAAGDRMAEVLDHALLECEEFGEVAPRELDLEVLVLGQVTGGPGLLR